MRCIKTLCLLQVIFFNLTYLQAQQPIEINLKRAVDNAVKTNINVIKTENNIESQSVNIKGKYGALIPSLSFTGGWQRSNSVLTGQALNNALFGNQSPPLNYQSYVPGSLNSTSYGYSLGLRSDVTLFNGFTNYQSIDEAKQTQAYNYILLQKTKQDIVLQVMNDYITVLKNQQIVKIDSATLANSQLQLDLVKQFVEAGRRTMVDIYNQDALVAQNELQLEQAVNELNKSISDLIFDSNLPQDKSYSVNLSDFSSDLTLDYVNAYATQNSNIEFLVNTALKNRYDYRSTEQVIKINETNFDIARNSVIFPTLSGFSSYDWSGSSFSNIANTKVFTLGLTLSFPIFEGFSIDNERQLAEIQVKSSNEDLAQLQKQITNDIQKAVLDLKSLVKQIEITDRTIKSAEQNKLLAEESYKVGLQTLLDVQTATTTYDNALIQKSNLIFNFQFAQKQLEYFQGLLKY